LAPAKHTSSKAVHHGMLFGWNLDAWGDPGTLRRGLFHQGFLGKVPGNLAAAGCRHYHLFRVSICWSWKVVNPS